MPASIVRVTPTDFDAWHRAHLAGVTRFGRAMGLVLETIYRDHDDPRTVVIVQVVEDIDRFRAVIASPEFQETVAAAPIDGPPVFWSLDLVNTLDVAALWPPES
ncbi:MAG: hypothetical protein ACKVVT_16520 [Dehalococcoidia bacterium]